ncbi:hypothetical protein BaRGS_00010908 [Batillaria attramentaria]|uniref:Uncharacterized protein n=1 Tax=Batillaria attramentaria TaxID=370345 RepID=A0ABD0LDY8_9CAEN
MQKLVKPALDVHDQYSSHTYACKASNSLATPRKAAAKNRWNSLSVVALCPMCSRAWLRPVKDITTLTTVPNTVCITKHERCLRVQA